MQLNNRTGIRTQVLVEQMTCHVTVMATMTNTFALHRAELDTFVLDLDHPKAGTDVVMQVRLVVAIVLCMVTIEEMQAAMVAGGTLAHLVEVEDKAIAIVDEAQIVSVGAQVLANREMVSLLLDPSG